MTRPLPAVDPLSAGFWEATARGELALAACAECGTVAHPPGPVCGGCGSTDPGWTWRPVGGGGRVCSWTVVRQAFLPGFEVPYTLLDVRLDEVPHVRLVGQLAAAPEDPADLRLDARVRVVFDDVADGVRVPAFVLAATA